MLVLACRCGAAEPLARKVMREAHFDAWQTHKVIKGRQACMVALSPLPNTPTTTAVRNFIERHSSWTIFLAKIDGEYRWVDVGHGGTKNRLDAEIILEKVNEQKANNTIH